MTVWCDAWSLLLSSLNHFLLFVNKSNTAFCTQYNMIIYQAHSHNKERKGQQVKIRGLEKQFCQPVGLNSVRAQSGLAWRSHSRTRLNLRRNVSMGELIALPRLTLWETPHFFGLANSKYYTVTVTRLNRFRVLDPKTNFRTVRDVNYIGML